MKYALLFLLLIPTLLFSQVEVSKQHPRNNLGFPIASGKTLSGVYFDAADYEAVKISAKLFVADVERVTDKMPELISSKSKLKDNVIIIGTVGKNRLINELVSASKLNVEPIRNQWERFIIKTVDNPFPGVKQALVIAGSDRRGTAYGVFTVSEAIGVSPWYWWADVPVKKSNVLTVKALDYVSKTPSVKYEGTEKVLRFFRLSFTSR